MRSATIQRKTAETDISLTLNLDGTGQSDIHTGCGFLDHMLTLLAAHARFDLRVSCTGDTQVDDHHTVEDIGIALGQALRSALGDKRGVRRYGQRLLPMDEVLALVAVDLSGPYPRRRWARSMPSLWRSSSSPSCERRPSRCTSGCSRARTRITSLRASSRP